MSGVHIFYAYMSVCGSVFLLIPCVLVMQLLMPRVVLARYWKEPYFRTAELALFCGALAPYRTLMFMWVAAFPRFGKKRNITEVHRLVPKWFRVMSAGLTLWLLVAFFLICVSTVGIFIYAYLIGHPIRLFR